MNLFAWIALCESTICSSSHDDCRKSPPAHFSKRSIQFRVSVFNPKGGRPDSGVDLITVARGGGLLSHRSTRPSYHVCVLQAKASSRDHTLLGHFSGRRPERAEDALESYLPRVTYHRVYNIYENYAGKCGGRTYSKCSPNRLQCGRGRFGMTKIGSRQN
jgi:hypothetical protein